MLPELPPVFFALFPKRELSAINCSRRFHYLGFYGSPLIPPWYDQKRVAKTAGHSSGKTPEHMGLVESRFYPLITRKTT